MLADYHRTVYDCSVHVHAPSGKRVSSLVPEWRRPGVSHGAMNVKISFCKRRPDFAHMQLNQLLRLHIPVHFGQEAITVSEIGDKVEVKTKSGDTFVGDVCLAADGIGSLFRRQIGGGVSDVQDSGAAVARVAFPREAVDPESLAWNIVKDLDVKPEFRHYLADGLHLSAFLTGDYVGLALTHPVRTKVNFVSITEAGLANADSLEKSPASRGTICNRLLSWSRRWRRRTTSGIQLF